MHCSMLQPQVPAKTEDIIAVCLHTLMQLCEMWMKVDLWRSVRRNTHFDASRREQHYAGAVILFANAIVLPWFCVKIIYNKGAFKILLSAVRRCARACVACASSYMMCVRKPNYCFYCYFSHLGDAYSGWFDWQLHYYLCVWLWYCTRTFSLCFCGDFIQEIWTTFWQWLFSFIFIMCSV